MSELSTGTRRLVDLAAVVAHAPTVVLLDEPSSGVAQREVEAMGELLRRVQRSLGATLVVVEHDIAFVAELADRLVALDRGMVLAMGEPEELLARTEVMETFLGSDPLTRTRSGALPTGGAALTGAVPPTEGRPVSDDPRPPVPAGDLPDRPVLDGPPYGSGQGPGPAGTARPWPKVGRVRRFGPVVVVVLALVAAGVVATTQSHASGAGPASAAGTGRSSSPSQVANNPLLPVTYQMAKKAGRTADYHWPAGCDFSTGRLSIPTVYAPPCVPAFQGSNGGATSPGVSATVITVVYYIPPPGDLASAIEGAAGTPATNLATAENYVAMLNHVIPLYGRRVVLVPYNATGISTGRGGRPGRRHQGRPADPRLRLHQRPGPDQCVPRRAGSAPRAVPRLRARVHQPGVPTRRPRTCGEPSRPTTPC